MRRLLLSTGIAVLAAAAAGLLWADGAAAQGTTTAAVSGTVVDQDGTPLSGVQVVVEDQRTGTQRGSLTDGSGRYFVGNLQPGGPYEVRVSRVGYATAEESGLQFPLGQNTRVAFNISEEALAVEGFDVLATRSQTFSRSRTGAGISVDEFTLENLPSISRNFADAAAISPHAHTVGQSVSVGGQNNRYNNIQIDGAVNNDLFGLAASNVPGGQAEARPIPLEAIQEFQVLVAPFDVRQSGFTGGLINAVTKSGTNQFAGSAYGYFRNQNFVGEFDGQEFGDFDNMNYGFTLGGPIARDRLHFFVAAEIEGTNQPSSGVNLGVDDPGNIGFTSGTAERIAGIAQDVYGIDPGPIGAYELGNPLGNAFGRLDFQINDNHRAVLRHNYAQAQADRGVGRGGGFNYDFGSYGIDQSNTTNSTVFQLFSDLGDRWSNELLMNGVFVRDRRLPLVQAPIIEVQFTDSEVPDAPGRQIRMGAERFSHQNELDQDNIQITNNLTGNFGDHQLTFGLHGEYYNFRNLFFPTSLGRYIFSSLDDFENNRPSQYEINLQHPDNDDINARFGVVQVGGYLQNDWTVSDRLTLTGGLRVDVPIMLDEPQEFPLVEQTFGLNNANIPTGNPLWAPRVGFNYNTGGLRQTQLRGGVGVFSGRPPFVWMSNAYGNTGRTTIMFSCSGENAPGMTTDVNNQPTECLDGSTAATGGRVPVAFFDEDFRFPQEFKANIAVDRELFAGFSGTAEVMYTRGINSINVTDENIPSEPVGTDPISGRPLYAPPSSSGFEQNPVSDEFLWVIRGTNRSDPQSLNLVLGLERDFLDRFNMRGYYTFQRAEDVRSMTSSQAASNFGFHAIGGDPNDPPITTSNFERPHKLTFIGSARLFERLGGTDLTLFYTGQSGSPYSYTVRGDVNGDDYPGVRNRADNDLIYVPSGDELTFASGADQRRFEELIALESCLQDARGSIMERNTCRGPWTNRLDLRIAQGIGVGPGRAQLVLDIFNLPHLLGTEFGDIRGVGSMQQPLEVVGRVDDDPSGDLIYQYIGNVEDGDAALPSASLVQPASRWQARLGLRYSF